MIRTILVPASGTQTDESAFATDRRFDEVILRYEIRS